MIFWSEINKDTSTVLRTISTDETERPFWAEDTDNSYWVEKDLSVPYRGIAPLLDSVYLEELNEFVKAKPFPSWVFDEDKFDWVAPVAHPDPDPFVAHLYDWNEETQAWDFIEKINVKEGY